MTSRMTNRALVLGGGGVTGIAWELGILAGLAEQGLDLTDADIVVGTSAGSVVGAQITSGLPVAGLYDDQLTPADKEIGAHFGRGTILRLLAPMLVPGSATKRLRRVGRAALKAQPGPADARVEVIRGRIGIGAWPDRDLRITAVNAETGQAPVLTRTSGVDLVRVVAASCAVPIVWPPVPLNGVPHIDGGIRSAANVDRAVGADRVVVLAPLARTLSRHQSIPAQLERLANAAGSDFASVVVSPDKQALADIGKNVLDPAKRADAARTGHRQAASCLDAVAAAWG